MTSMSRMKIDVMTYMAFWSPIISPRRQWPDVAKPPGRRSGCQRQDSTGSDVRAETPLAPVAGRNMLHVCLMGSYMRRRCVSRISTQVHWNRLAASVHSPLIHPVTCMAANGRMVKIFRTLEA